MAMKLPARMDSTAINMIIVLHVSCRPPRPSTSTRNSMASAASLGAVARYSVTGVRAPSYTSGSHMWNGTAPNLNAMPTIMNARPNHSGRLFKPGSALSAAAISWNCSEPVTP